MTSGNAAIVPSTLVSAVVACAAETPGWLRQVPAVQTVRAVWVQQYYRDQQGLRWRGKDELPPGVLAIGSPYDTQARYGIKRGVGWRG